MGTTAIAKPCDRTYRAIHDSGKRSVHDVTLWVIHVSEAPSAVGVARYFTDKESGGSTQLVVDNYRCFRCLPNDVIPWGAAGANDIGIHIEHCGYAAWSRDHWLKVAKPTINRGAYKCAVHLHKYGIPHELLSAEDLIRGKHHGITTHHAVNVWQSHIGAPGDHSHTCPGPNFPLDIYMELVHKHYAKL